MTMRVKLVKSKECGRNFCKPRRVLHALCATGQAYTTYDPVLCATGLRRKVHVPKGCTKLDVVFTKKPNAGSFQIVPHLSGPASGRVKEYGGELWYTFELMTGEALGKGYKYVHVEY